MKHVYALIAGLFFSLATFAQLPDGSIAPDFTATDLDGVEHNLYDLLDEGKQVILEFSATWCGPCWNYALTGTLDELHEMYGPDGTDEIRVFYIEADDTTTLEDLQGTGTATVGDWTSVVHFPIIDDGGSIFTDFGGAYYPTIYTICPNRIVTESGQLDAAGHTAIFQANSCAAASLMNDPALLGYTGGTTACIGDPVNMSVELMNLGLTNLGYCTIAVMDGATELLSYDWSGDLGTYAIENVELGTAVFDTDTDFTIEIMSTDENTANNSSSGSVVLAVDGTSLIHVEIMIDNWPQEISWSITDASGSVIESVSAGEIGGNEGDIVEWWVSAPSEGCYTFEIGDTYGDGIYGSQWGSIDGFCTVKSFTEELVYASTIYDYNGSYNFESEQAGFFADPSLLTIGCTDSVACNFDPSAIEDDGSCTYPGCMDPLATNYDSSAGCSAECIYLTYDCASIGQSGWADESIGLYPEWQDAMHGVAWEGEWVFNIPSMIEEPSSGVEYAVHHIDWTAVNGLPDWVDEAEFILGELGGASQHCIQAVGTPTAPSTHDISAVGEVFISIFGQPFSIGIQTYTAILEVVGNPNPIPGCMYSNAVNYTSYSTEDDGSCLFAGCTDPDSADFNPIATIDDGSCGEGCDPDANTTCTSDNNGDGVVNVSDLLILLGEFGGDCE